MKDDTKDFAGNPFEHTLYVYDMRALDALLSLGVLFIPSAIALCVFWPGYFQADHQVTIATIALGQPNTIHSLFWGYLAFPFLYCLPSYGYYGFVQITLFTVLIFAALLKLKRIGAIKKSILPLAAFMGLFPTFVMYNLLWSSDMVFTYVLFYTCVLLFEIVATCGACFNERRFAIELSAFLALGCLLRRTALLIPLILLILLTLRYRQHAKTICLSIVSSLLVFATVSFGLPPLVNATSTPQQEALAIPSFQIAAAYSKDAEISDWANDVFCSMKTPEEWKVAYSGYTADTAKDKVGFSPEFLMAWLETGFNNPRVYLNAYDYLLHPFWEFGCAESSRGSNDIFCGTRIDFGSFDDFTLRYSDSGKLREGYLSQFGNEKSDVWAAPKGWYKSANESDNPLLIGLVDGILFNRALPLWFLLAFIVIGIVRKNAPDYLVLSSALCGVMLVLLAFAPVALFRYSAELYYSLPLLALFVMYDLR